jgi:hypothetical protein
LWFAHDRNLQQIAPKEELTRYFTLTMWISIYTFAVYWAGSYFAEQDNSIEPWRAGSIPASASGLKMFLLTSWPIVYDNLDGYARLASQLKTSLQLGENFYGPRDMHRAIQMKACDLVMPDFMRIGGVTGWLRSAAIAAASGVPISTHLYPEVAAQVMRVSETMHWLEWQNWVNPILKQPYEVTQGMLQIPPLAGVGLEWDDNAVARNAA